MNTISHPRNNEKPMPTIDPDRVGVQVSDDFIPAVSRYNSGGTQSYGCGFGYTMLSDQADFRSAFDGNGRY